MRGVMQNAAAAQMSAANLRPRPGRARRSSWYRPPKVPINDTRSARRIGMPEVRGQISAGYKAAGSSFTRGSPYATMSALSRIVNGADGKRARCRCPVEKLKDFSRRQFLLFGVRHDH